MTDIRLYPNTMFGRNRDEYELWTGYVDADLGTISAETKVSLTEVDRAGPVDEANDADISFDLANDEIDLKSGNVYRISVNIDQTGASSKAEIYDVTNTAVLYTTPAQEGYKSFQYILRTTADISISFRLDDQTANSITASTNQIVIERIGRVEL